MMFVRKPDKPTSAQARKKTTANLALNVIARAVPAGPAPRALVAGAGVTMGNNTRAHDVSRQTS
jgi:hypothetical protein